GRRVRGTQEILVGADRAQQDLQALPAPEEAPSGPPAEELGWLDWMPPLAQMRLLAHITGILNALLVLAATLPGGLFPMPIALAADVLILTATAIMDREGQRLPGFGFFSDRHLRPRELELNAASVVFDRSGSPI